LRSTMTLPLFRGTTVPGASHGGKGEFCPA
jgi:hypothetical protein